jgi:hypothetical protein
LGSPLDEVANDVLAVISGSSIELSQIFTHVINFYIAPEEPEDPTDEERKAYQEKVDLQSKVTSVAQNASDPSSITTLEGYVREALRRDPVIEGVWRVATQKIDVGPLAADAGDKFYFDFGKAGKSDNAFENAENIDPTRPASAYGLYHGDTVFKILGEAFVTRAAAQVLRAVLTQRGVKRTKGIAGTLRRYREPVILVPDTVTVTEEKVPYKQVAKDGSLVDTDWVEKVNKYTLVPNEDPDLVADRWSYLDPEIGHAPTTWATGLTLTFS